MKQDNVIDHTKEGMDAFGISPARCNEIDEFLARLILIGQKKNLRRSHVVERIIGFANNTTEALAIFLKLESVLRKHFPTQKVEVEFVGAPSDMLPEILKKIAGDLMNIEAIIRQERDKYASGQN